MSVLESTYTKLRKFGVPLPVCICMQDKGLQLESAQWTARQSCGGFSVTFFWPAPNQETKATVKPSAKRKRRKRRIPKPVGPKKLFTDSVNGHAASSSISGKQSVRTPFIAHHLSANSQKSAHPPAPDSNVDINQREDSSLAIQHSVRILLNDMISPLTQVLQSVKPGVKSPRSNKL